MNTQFNIEEILAQGKITSELELERAMIADRKLRTLSKEHPKLKAVRKQLRDLIEEYESAHWSSEADISEEQLKDSDVAEDIAEEERIFIKNRREAIRKKLKELGLNQQQFGEILGHNSKSYISELMNGVTPFSLRDLVVIHNLLGIPLKRLIPTRLELKDRQVIQESIKKLGTGKIKLGKSGLVTK